MAKAKRTTAEKVREVVHKIADRGGVESFPPNILSAAPGVLLPAQAEDIQKSTGGVVWSGPTLCRHPDGFWFIGKTSADGVTVLLLTYCARCWEQRRLTANGRVVASCAAGGEWREW